MSFDLNEQREARRQKLSERLAKKVFRPFAIVLQDGKRLEIVRPLQAAVGLTTFMVGPADLSGNIVKQYALDDVDTIEFDGAQSR